MQERRHLWPAMVAAAAAVALALVLLVARPAHAADPSPPYVGSSSPGGYQLFGYHQDPLGDRIDCWGGVQYRKTTVHQYRLWLKCRHRDGAQVAVEFSHLQLDAWGLGSYTEPASVTSGTTVYRVGNWRRVYSGWDVSAKGQIKARRIGGPAYTEYVGSYLMRAVGKYPVGGPVA